MVYGSYTVPNPNAAFHDFSNILRATDGEVMASRCLVSHVNARDVARSRTDCSECMDNTIQQRQRRQAATDVTIYIAIEGTSEAENRFTFDSSFGDAFGKILLPVLLHFCSNSFSFVHRVCY